MSILNIKAALDKSIEPERSNEPSYSYAARDIHDNVSADEWIKSMSYNEDEINALLINCL